MSIPAFGMSMGSFAAAFGKRAMLKRPPVSETLRTGKSSPPIIGLVASQYIMRQDHRIAFVLLFAPGMRMMKDGLSNTTDEEAEAPRRHGFWLLVTTAIVTSLDAMAVGVGLAFLNVNIVATVLMIGFATTIMATTGMLLGRFPGAAFDKRAEVSGGVVVICIGSSILIDHLGLLSLARTREIVNNASLGDGVPPDPTASLRS